MGLRLLLWFSRLALPSEKIFIVFKETKRLSLKMFPSLSTMKLFGSVTKNCKTSKSRSKNYEKVAIYKCIRKRHSFEKISHLFGDTL